MALTEKQKEAAALLKNTDNVLLYGGARSGKTYVTIMYYVFQCQKHPKFKGLIARRYATDIRASVWNDTLKKVLDDLGLHEGKDFFRIEQSMTITFDNKSIIVCAGLDDKERVDKILGQEYSAIYINESQDVGWPTIKTLTTRLSQNVGARNQLIADLNPTSVMHWTFKLFLKRVHPETGKEMPEDQFKSIQMNPIDNIKNLPSGYIGKYLETLSGSSRNRFLLGEYTTDSDIMIFNPQKLYQWKDFTDWMNDRWNDVMLVSGLDIGYRDADAFCVLAYIDGDPITWLVYERKIRKNSIEELAEVIKQGMKWCSENILNRVKNFDIYSDLATVRYGKEGDNKKTARELSDRFGLPTRPAYKRDKKMRIEFLRDDIKNDQFKVLYGGPFAEEMVNAVWTRLEDGSVIHVVDDEIYHPDMMDAILYAHAFITQYGNSALTNRENIVTHNTEVNSFDHLEKMREALETYGGGW